MVFKWGLPRALFALSGLECFLSLAEQSITAPEGNNTGDAVEIELLSFTELDALQRTAAKAWMHNDRCLERSLTVIDAATEAGENSGMCMAETLLDHVRRKARVEELVPRDIAVNMSSFMELLGAKHVHRPQRYSFLRTQQNIKGGEEAKSLIDLCHALQRTYISAVPWPEDITSTKLEETSDLVRALVRKEGAALLHGMVPEPELLDQVAKYVLWKGAFPNSNFTEYVHDTKHRHHMRLKPSEHPVVATLFRLLVQRAASILLPLVSPLGAIIEFAAFLTNPGAHGQHLHTDTLDSLESQHAPVYSLFLFLTDIEEENEGPLQIVPQSHALSDVRDATRQAALMLERGSRNKDPKCLSHWKLLPVKQGDAAFYDGTVLHRGTRNTSPKTRIVVYLTFMGIGSAPEGSRYAIDNSLLEPPLRLGNLLDAMQEHKTLSADTSSDVSRPEL